MAWKKGPWAQAAFCAMIGNGRRPFQDVRFHGRLSSGEGTML